MIMKISNLNKQYNNFTLRDINIELQQGSIMGFIGPNGAGKSTTIKSILNIINYDSGKILIDGMDNKKDATKVKQIVGYVSEYLNFYEEVSAVQFYKFVSKYYMDWDDKLFQHLVKIFNIDLTKNIGSLSKGTGMKFALSLALSHHPKLLILDEPTSGLDPVVRNETLELLKDTVANEHTSVFFSSHITEDIIRIADYVTYINKGQILLSDRKENLLKNYKKVVFYEDAPEQIRHQFSLYRNKTAIVNDTIIKHIRSNGLKDYQFEYSSASLDEILLLLIEESSVNAESNN